MGRNAAIGLESSNLVMQAFSNSKNLSLAEQNLKAIFEVELVKVKRSLNKFPTSSRLNYHGKRCISCPIFRVTSIMLTKLGFGNFGNSCMLTMSAIITILKNLSILTCGYSGLMLLLWRCRFCSRVLIELIIWLIYYYTQPFAAVDWMVVIQAILL